MGWVTRIPLLLVFICCWWTAQAGSGSHGVGNGGDVAELQAIQVWSRSKEMATQCLQRTQFCPLNDLESEKILNFLEEFERRGAILLRATHEDWAYQTEQSIGAPIIINSISLYHDEVPLLFAEIAPVVLEALFYQFGSDQEVARSMAIKISSFWQFQSVIKSVDHYGEKLTLIAVNSQKGFQAFLDLPEKSFEISELFQRNVPCDGIVDELSVVFTTEVVDSQFVVRGQVNGFCKDGGDWRSEFLIEIFLESKMTDINLEKSSIRFINAKF